MGEGSACGGLFPIYVYIKIQVMGKAKKETPKHKNKINLKKNFKRIQENNRVLKALLENQG
jgi:hypothetical protein